MKELELKEMKRAIRELTARFDELSRSVGKIIRKQQEFTEMKVNKNPLAYMAGAFVGGLIVGHLLGRGKGSCSRPDFS
ncbi:MAG: hypothetical protein FIB07_10795 [Candidatus Methanoperedens sp.]|nr:hypothetical protein [Candidatus Methanoperedens sp.]